LVRNGQSKDSNSASASGDRSQRRMKAELLNGTTGSSFIGVPSSANGEAGVITVAMPAHAIER
jgi:hypothetical protein